jgi:hypothetical protein
MSYLNVPRLHFSGKFQADVSTVNNDPAHYNNKTFQPSDDEPQSLTQPNGWWNPRGSGSWRLVNCQVTKVVYQDGDICTDSKNDAVVGMQVGDSGSRVAAKLVDLDSEQQWVSEIWGLTVRLLDVAGTSRVGGLFKVSPFFDIWRRAQGKAGGDQVLAAAYQSVINALTWGDVADSRFLRELKDAVGPDGALSIKFNLDGYNMTSTSAEFTLGRIAGTIGVAQPGEPDHFVAGRQMMPALDSRVAPSGKVFFFPGLLDERRRKVVVDLGNALPTTTPGGPLFDLGTLGLGLSTPDGTVTSTLGQINYLQSGWYEQTAGVQEFPAERPLSDQELEQVKSTQLALFSKMPKSPPNLLVQEATGGFYVGADMFVFRANPGDKPQIHFYATCYGQPLANTEVLCFLDGSQLQPSGPPVAIPPEALSFTSRLRTDAQGRATLTVTTHPPGNPRGYIDGQIYGIGYKLALADSQAYNYNLGNFISMLVWDEYKVPDKPSWEDVQPTFQQYANLYPVMKPFVDLGNLESVVRNKALIQMAMSLPMENPNYMPVTRDLSAGKREMILKWLATASLEQQPRASSLESAPVPPAPRRSEPRPDLARLGGKTAAMGRRNPAIAEALSDKKDD